MTLIPELGSSEIANMSESPPKIKVLCAISHGLYEPWISILEEGQSQTWLTDRFPAGFEVLHFHGTPVGKLWLKVDKFHEYLRWKNIWVARFLRVFDSLITWPFLIYIPRISKSELLLQKHLSLHLRLPDTYLTYRWKLLSMLKFFIEETDADFLFITTTASYVQPSLVLSQLEKLPMYGTYAGAEPYPGAGFVSGSNRIFSRDIATQVLENRIQWKAWIIEDLAVSNLLKSLGNQIVLYPIFNISSVEELDSVPDDKLSTTYHFLLKSGPLRNRKDVEIMRTLHTRIQTLKGHN